MSTTSRRTFGGAMAAAALAAAGAIPAMAQDDAECLEPAAADAPADAPDDASYVVVRRWKLKPDVDYAEFTQLVKEGYVPIIQQVEGFVAYYFANPGDGGHMAVAIFTSKEGAEASTVAAEEWTAANIADLVDGPPVEVTEAEIWMNATPDDVASRA